VDHRDREPGVLRWVLGVSFIGMAIWTMIPDKIEEEEAQAARRYGVFGATLITFFFAEMGDKTQIATVAMAAHFASPVLVVIGTTLGMLLADVPAVLLGDKLAMGNLLLCMLYGAPGANQEAACLALDQYDAVTKDIRATHRRRRDLVHGLLAAVPGLSCPSPQAGMSMMVDVRGTGLMSNDFAWGLLRHGGVSVLDARAFGPSAAGPVRLGLIVDDARLVEACRRIRCYCAMLRA